MTLPTRRRLATTAAAFAGAAVLLAAQGTSPSGATIFHLYLLGRDAGRETDTLSIGQDGNRHFEATFAYFDRGAEVRLTTSFDAAVDWSARHLAVRGQPFRDGTTDLDLTVAGGRAQIRDRGAVSSVDVGSNPFFPLDGAGPIGLQEQLVRYWRSHGRPKEIASAPGGPIHIEKRADEQIDLGRRSLALERLAIEGPVWGQETAWVEPGGDLAALTTWAARLPLLAVRDGFEARLDRFLEEAARDRIAEFERINAAAVAEYPEGVTLVGATVVVGGKRPPIPDATVVVRGDRIVAVGPSARIRPPEELPKVEARGMTIIAGLWDMQASSPHPEWMAAYLAAGITGVRSVSGQSTLLTALRDVLAEGHSLGPRMTLGGMVDGGGASALGTVQAASPEDGRQAVRRYRGDGFRQIEIGSSVTLPALRAIALEAHRFGVIVSGPVPDGLTTAQALDAGLDQLESVPADLSTDAAMGAAMPLFLAHHTILEPLAAWAEYLRRPNSASIAAFEPGIARAPASIERMLASLGGSAPAPDRAEPPSPINLIRAARAAGVVVVAGSNGGIPGLSLLRELELFVQAGMAPLEALQTATSIPAQLMRMDDSGTIEAGKRADFVVLTADPLANISNLRTAKWVVANGKLYDCAKLRKAAGFRN